MKAAATKGSAQWSPCGDAVTCRLACEREQTWAPFTRLEAESLVRHILVLLQTLNTVHLHKQQLRAPPHDGLRVGHVAPQHRAHIEPRGHKSGVVCKALRPRRAAAGHVHCVVSELDHLREIRGLEVAHARHGHHTLPRIGQHARVVDWVGLRGLCGVWGWALGRAFAGAAFGRVLAFG